MPGTVVCFKWTEKRLFNFYSGILCWNSFLLQRKQKKIKLKISRQPLLAQGEWQRCRNTFIFLSRVLKRFIYIINPYSAPLTMRKKLSFKCRNFLWAWQARFFVRCVRRVTDDLSAMFLSPRRRQWECLCKAEESPQPPPPRGRLAPALVRVLNTRLFFFSWPRYVTRPPGF